MFGTHNRIHSFVRSFVIDNWQHTTLSTQKASFVSLCLLAFIGFSLISDIASTRAPVRINFIIIYDKSDRVRFLFHLFHLSQFYLLIFFVCFAFYDFHFCALWRHLNKYHGRKWNEFMAYKRIWCNKEFFHDRKPWTVTVSIGFFFFSFFFCLQRWCRKMKKWC